MTKQAYTNAAQWFSAQSFHPIAEAQAQVERQRQAHARDVVLGAFGQKIAELDRLIAQAETAQSACKVAP